MSSWSCLIHHRSSSSRWLRCEFDPCLLLCFLYHARHTFKPLLSQQWCPGWKTRAVETFRQSVLARYSFHFWLAFIGASCRYGPTSGWGAAAQPRNIPSVPLLWHQPALGTTARWCYLWLLPLEYLNSAFWVLLWSFDAKSTGWASRQLCESHLSIKETTNLLEAIPQTGTESSWK